MLDLSTDTYMVPAGDGAGPGYELRLADILAAESRLHEVAAVTLHKAPELMSTFNEMWLKLQRSAVILTYARSKAEVGVKRAKAQALLNCDEAAVKAHGHPKSSQDLREAVAELDPGLATARDRLDEIKAVLELVQGKMEAFANAYSAVKKLVATMQLPSQPLRDGNRPEPYGAPRPDKNDAPSQPLNDDDPLPDWCGKSRY